MAAATSQQTAMPRGRLKFSSTLTIIHVCFPAVPASGAQEAAARISFNVNNSITLSDGATLHNFSFTVPFERPLTDVLQRSPDTTRSDMRNSLLDAMRDPYPGVVDCLISTVYESAVEAADEAVLGRSDGFDLVAEINVYMTLSDIRSVGEEVTEDTLIFNCSGSGRRVSTAGDVASSIISKMRMVEFGKDCGSGEGDSCSICLVEYEVGMRLKKTECSHVFHEDCLRPWLLRNASCPSCPMCRVAIAAN